MMASFHWGPHFETGLSKVDDQHHHLVDMINRFGKLLVKSEANIEDVDSLFNQLADYAIYHFKEEEKMMVEVKVDPRHISSHINVHNGFLDEVTSIYSSISPQNINDANYLLKFLAHWLAYHILGKDQDLAKQVKAIKSGISPKEAYDSLENERESATAPLLDALSGLFEQVSMRNKELKDLNESLEEKVALRTEELSKANKHLEELSLTDALTGLPNRRHAMRRLSSLWAEAVQNNTSLVCIMIDADHFKEVNDLYGHDAGDMVLIELAKTLSNGLRNDDVVCRLGGDEFFIICPNTKIEGGMHIAELTLEAVKKLRVTTGGKPWVGSISVGVASLLSTMNHYEELIKEADKALYLAKESGRNCIKTSQ